MPVLFIPSYYHCELTQLGPNYKLMILIGDTIPALHSLAPYLSPPEGARQVGAGVISETLQFVSPVVMLAERVW